jgi:hypothetical protein
MLTVFRSHCRHRSRATDAARGPLADGKSGHPLLALRAGYALEVIHQLLWHPPFSQIDPREAQMVVERSRI